MESTAAEFIGRREGPFFKGKEGSLWKCLPFYDSLAFLNGFCLVARLFFSHSYNQEPFSD